MPGATIGGNVVIGGGNSIVRVSIDGQEVSEKDITVWKRKHTQQALKNLRKSVPANGQAEKLRKIKSTESYEEMIKPLRSQIVMGNIGMKLAAVFSFGKRKRAVTTLYMDGIHVDELGKCIDELMMHDTEENRKVNLNTCPEHYAMVSRGDTLEVVEKTGCCPLVTQFFITFNDETGLITPRNENYPYQSVGIAKLKDGTIIGGVRHQFRDTKTGIMAKLVVEFPALCPSVIVKDHQKHLAVEWSGWIDYAVREKRQE